MGMMAHFVADERTNAVVLLANEVETRRVEELITLLDRQVPKGEEKIRVYYLEHASAEDLVKVLQEIPAQKTPRIPKDRNRPRCCPNRCTSALTRPPTP